MPQIKFVYWWQEIKGTNLWNKREILTWWLPCLIWANYGGYRARLLGWYTWWLWHSSAISIIMIWNRELPGLTLPDQLFVPIMDIVCGCSGKQYTCFVLTPDHCICIVKYRQSLSGRRKCFSSGSQRKYKQTNASIVKATRWYNRFCSIKSSAPSKHRLILLFLQDLFRLWIFLRSHMTLIKEKYSMI